LWVAVSLWLIAVSPVIAVSIGVALGAMELVSVVAVPAPVSEPLVLFCSFGPQAARVAADIRPRIQVARLM